MSFSSSQLSFYFFISRSQKDSCSESDRLDAAQADDVILHLVRNWKSGAHRVRYGTCLWLSFVDLVEWNGKLKKKEERRKAGGEKRKKEKKTCERNSFLVSFCVWFFFSLFLDTDQ